MAPRPFPESKAALPVAVLLTLAVVAVALWVRADPVSPPFQGLDDAWLGVMGGPHDGALWVVADAFNHSGGPVGIAIVLVIAGTLLVLRRWASALFAVVAVTATYYLVDVLKLVGDRDRPPDPMVGVASNAFPSGHAARMASLVVVLTVVAVPVAARRWWWPLAAALVLAMMWSRTWQHAHWLTDTVGGAAFAIGVSMLCWRAFDPLLRRERERRADMARIRDAPNGAKALPLAPPLPDRPKGSR
ncbi:phosphatase PAP2 family protein [Glycomyces tarimensis]